MSTRENRIKSDKTARRPRVVADSHAPLDLGVAHEAESDLEVSKIGGVQSIGRAFAILEEVARNRDGIGLAELSKRVGLHNSTTFHLVKTMASALDEIEMVSLATPILEDLSVKSGQSSHFAVRMSDAVVVMARTAGPSAFQMTDRVGLVRPAHCTALGKVILAALRAEQLDRFLERADLKPHTSKSITEIAPLRREIAEVRRTGMAFDDGEFDPEVRCVAVPVQDFTNQVIGAIGISGPVWRMSIQTLQGLVPVVRDAAQRLSAEFGSNAGQARRSSEPASAAGTD